MQQEQGPRGRTLGCGQTAVRLTYHLSNCRFKRPEYEMRYIEVTIQTDQSSTGKKFLSFLQTESFFSAGGHAHFGQAGYRGLWPAGSRTSGILNCRPERGGDTNFHRSQEWSRPWVRPHTAQLQKRKITAQPSRAQPWGPPLPRSPQGGRERTAEGLRVHRPGPPLSRGPMGSLLD